MDTTEYEKILKGEDDETVREVLKELKDEKKGQQFKQIQKIDVLKINLAVVKE